MSCGTGETVPQSRVLIVLAGGPVLLSEQLLPDTHNVL